MTSAFTDIFFNSMRSIQPDNCSKYDCEKLKKNKQICQAKET